MNTKYCPNCQLDKPVQEFYKRTSNKDGLNYRCKACIPIKKYYEAMKKASKTYREKNTEKLRENAIKKYRLSQSDKEAHSLLIFRRNLKKLYKMTLEEYQQLEKEQNYCCYICKNPSSNGKRLSVDHCHRSGKIRKLLCNNCNIALGLFKENKESLINALNYLNLFK